MLELRIAPVAIVLIVAAGVSQSASVGATVVCVTGDVRDSATGAAIASRLYIQSEDGTWHFPASSDSLDVVRYERENHWNKSQVEMHATLAAKPFSVDLTAGEYTVIVERGKEYAPLKTKLTVDESHAQWHLRPSRWIDMASRHWYSGDMHCHRSIDELANLQVAEDLNVCFPLTYWTRIAEKSPSHGDNSTSASLQAGPVSIDATHVWYPRNTEYEIFKVRNREHTLGAFLILNHHAPFDMPVLPLAAVARQAHNEGALIDLEKHNWEWAAVAAPILSADLFELANNHNWRIGFGVKNWGVPAANWMNLKGPLTIDNEPDWIEYGWQFYYALLNCGLPIKPSAGSASGVHPVPVGYSRVYVHLPRGFDYGAWMSGLAAGRSFVTTGPMLLVTVNDRDPGETFSTDASQVMLHIHGEACADKPLNRIEIVWNGEVIRSIPPTNEPADNAFVSRFDLTVPANASGWLAARCVAEPRETGGIPFAHTGPWHIKIAGRPLLPRQREVAYFLGLVEREIDRNRNVLGTEQLADYYKARDFWRRKLDEIKTAPARSN